MVSISFVIAARIKQRATAPSALNVFCFPREKEEDYPYSMQYLWHAQPAGCPR